jgi:hypothetical protein
MKVSARSGKFFALRMFYDKLDISVGTSKSNLSKAKQKIRKEIESC